MTTGQGPHFCDQVRREVSALADKLDEIGTNVTILINREKPPCMDYNKRITNLEVTKIALGGGWKFFGIFFGGIVGLAGTVTGVVMLIERLR